ncbi:MAG: O-methyltransferase [Flavobacteriales bacterium]
MEFLPKKLDDYVCEHTQQENDILKDLNRETWAKVLIPRMLSGHLQGRTLAMLSKMINPKNILEIGTYTGYSAICLSEGLQENGLLHTIDINEELYTMSSSYFKKAGIADKIIQHVGDANNIIPEIDLKWDLIFIDADKENYANYFDLVIDNLAMGGFIIADNVLWSGKVIEKINEKDKETAAIVDFNKKIQLSNRVENVLMPIRDGLMVCRKIK